MSSKLEKKKLPRGWRLAQLGDICEESRCSIDGKSIEARELPYLSLENIESHSGKIILDSDHNSYTQGTSNCFRFECEHVLYGKLRPYLNKVALPDFSGRCTTELIPISPSSDIEREFLALTLRRPETVNWAMAEITGSRMPRANMKRLMRLEIPLPPLSEQKRIVADLNKKMAVVEKVRVATLERVETIRALPAAFLREIFSFDDGKLPQGWRWTQLRDVCEVCKGTTPRTGWYAESGLHIIKFRDIVNGGINWVPGHRSFVSLEYENKLRRIKTGMTLIGADAHNPEYIGKKVGFTDSISKEPAFFSGELISITPRADRPIIAQWPFLWFTSHEGYKAVQEKVVGVHLNSGPAKSIEIPLPPLSEQKRIVADLNKKMAAVEKAREAAEAESEATHALPAAFLRKAFSGAL